MQLVIEISDGLYNNLDEIKNGSTASKIILDCVRKGRVLPKGHGKIGDLTKLYNEIDARNKGKNKGKYTGILALVGFADTIIEADKEIEE